jgi:hypothetical protein
MSTIKIANPGSSFNTENTKTDTSSTVSTITVSGGIATITTTAAHGRAVADVVTFSGATGVTGWNSAALTVLAVPSATVFTVATSLAVPTGTVLVLPCFYPLPGDHFFTMGANAVFEYNPTNDGYPNGTDPTATTTLATTWRTVLAASTAGEAYCDGFAMRVRCNATAGTTYWSRVK